MKFLETQVVQNFSLSNSQKMVLAMIASAPSVAGKLGRRIHIHDEKMSVAKDVLVKLGLITPYDNGLLALSPRAIDMMKEDGLMDEAESLTDVGQSFAAGKLPQEMGQTDQISNSPALESKVSFKQYLHNVI